MKIFSDILEFISALRFVDIVFFMCVLILIILIVTLIYFIKINDDTKDIDELEETQEMKIAREIQNNMNTTSNVEFSDYEKEQEQKAIISYDELLKRSNNYELNYESENVVDDFSVKKVDLDNVAKTTTNPSNIDVRVISFAKEEAFLKALKQLQKELG